METPKDKKPVFDDDDDAGVFDDEIGDFDDSDEDPYDYDFNFNDD